MRYLLILDAALFAMAGTLAVVLGVVLILYSFHTELSARVPAEMAQVAAVAGCFALLSAATGTAFWSLLRSASWRWWAQGGALLSMALGALFLYDQLAA